MAGKAEGTTGGKLDNPAMGTTGADNACVVAKALNRLVAMGSSRPQTLAKLSATLQSCTAVIPYLNPIHALELANGQANKPPPRVELPQTKLTVYAPYEDVNLKFWEAASRDFQRDKKYFTYPPQEVEEAMFQKALQWLLTDPEGTEESLLKELFQTCRKEQHLEVGSLFEGIQKMGFVDASGDGTVSYHLPSPSDLWTLKEMLQIHGITICSSPYIGARYKVNVVYCAACRDRMRVKIGPGTSLSGADPVSFSFGEWAFPMTIHVAELHALCLLSEMESDDRPRHLSDLLRVLEPACRFLYLASPSNVLMDYAEQIRHRLPLSERMKRRVQKGRGRRTCPSLLEFAIGVSEERQQVIIPLTPEGLLGVSVASEQELKNASEAASVTRWNITGQSRGFAAMLVKHLMHVLQKQGAVLVQATGQQKSEIVYRVSDWVDRYRNDPSGETETDTGSGLKTHSQPVPLKQLQRELIAKCTVKMVKLPASAVATLLEQQGFIRMDRDDPAQPVNYLIPELSRGTAPAWRVAASKYWKTSVKMCYSGVLARYFPPRKKLKKTKSVRHTEQYVQSQPREQDKLNQYMYIIAYSFLVAFVALMFGLFISRSGIA